MLSEGVDQDKWVMAVIEDMEELEVSSLEDIQEDFQMVFDFEE